MQGPYADHILDARDVCNNCGRRTRVERVDAVRGGLGTELDSHYSRDRQQTTVDYHDSHPEPAHSKTVFCQCGVEGSFERLWSPTSISRDRFKQILKRVIQTLELKGVSLRRKETIGYALSHFDDHEDADKALATAIEAGIVASAAASSDRDKEAHRA